MESAEIVFQDINISQDNLRTANYSLEGVATVHSVCTILDPP